VGPGCNYMIGDAVSL